MAKSNQHIGSSLDAFLREEGIIPNKVPDAHEGIRQGLDDAAHGRTRSAKEFFEEFEVKNNIPRHNL